MPSERIAVVGASGFIGRAVAEALGDAGRDVLPVSAGRLSTPARETGDLLRAATAEVDRSELAAQLAAVDVVVNAAGDPDASSLDEDALFGANALLPAVIAEASARAGVKRMVHISSAVVQNDKELLDSSEDMRPFSPYSASKVAGELCLRAVSERRVEVVSYRPPSVHAPERRVTRMISRIASSPAATVARPGDQLTPQALLPNVASAVAFLATTALQVPWIVHHPSEGVTVAMLMEDLSGGRRPKRIPRWTARAAVRASKAVGRIHRPTAANARRIEVLWLGQRQADSWLTEVGWEPAVGAEGWRELVPVNVR